MIKLEISELDQTLAIIQKFVVNMDINDLMCFEKSETSNAYCLALTENGQVYYCVADEEMKPSGEWKLVSIDEKAMSVYH